MHAKWEMQRTRHECEPGHEMQAEHEVQGGHECKAGLSYEDCTLLLVPKRGNEKMRQRGALLLTIEAKRGERTGSRTYRQEATMWA